MSGLEDFVAGYGYAFLVAVGFAEYAGVPIVSVPFVIGAGAMAAGGGLDPFLAATATGSGAALADGTWFALARWKGDRIVDAACGLTSHPTACVLEVEGRVSHLGALFVLPSKFVPGAGNLVAPASGLSGMAPLRFLTLDGLAIAAWAGAYVALGWVFADQVETVITWVERYTEVALVAALVLIAVATGWRILRRRIHREGHERHAPTEPAS